MKKVFFSFLMFFACAMGMQAKTIYLNTAGGWEDGGCNKFAIWYWGGSISGEWSSFMTQVAPKTWSTNLPDGATNVLFCRFNPNVPSPTWNREGDAYWGKSCDQEIPADKNMFKPTMDWEGGDDGCYKGGTWSVYTEGPVDYYIAGEGLPGVSWGEHLKMTDGTISFTGLAAGTYRFKVTNGNWEGIILGFSDVNASCSTADAYSGDSDGNIVVNLTKGGDITVSVTDGRLCVTVVGETQPSYGTAVPSQCGDVLMQGFYFDSYEVDETHPGTLQYGDTKWKTLLAQAGEIGAYFDLIWLPPSGYASGTGYHPKQYSNQNSDWGSRTDLEKLIAAFHNSGTKVVADIVINHVEAMASWCDFAALDFGEYGKFQPDGSYICSNDEMNADWTRSDTLAGPCWGTATGSQDDGANWDGARDWSHDKVYVQEMFKAYLKWMKNVIGYDGWRYDKGDGFNNWHMDNYNKASEPYIAFMEYWSGNDEIIHGIEDANRNVMALDFQTKYSAFDGIAGFDYSRCQGSGLLGRGYSKYAVTFIDSHDWFLRGNDQEFGGDGKSMTAELKDRLLQANAFMLSMPGVPCVFYPHWYKYKEDLKPMIDARHLAGVHSESPVTDEMADHDGYQCTVQGKNGYLIVQLGNKTTHTAWDPAYKLIAKGNGYAIWVNASGDVAPGLIVTPSASFEDKVNGITVTAKATGANASSAKIYYTTDGSNPTTSSSQYTSPLNFKETTTLKIMAVCGSAQSKVQEYTYTYREPLQRGIRVRFNKPEAWNKAYIYAWIPGVDGEGNPTSENIMGAYPGQRIYQDVEGWYSYEFDASMDSVNFCINSGDECGGINVRSNDLVTDYDVCYGWRDGKEEESNEEEVLDCELDLHPAFDLAISPESSFFRDQTAGLPVTISTIGIENAMVYYTTDGSEPTTASTAEPSPVTLNIKQTTTVKAYAVHDKDRTETKTATFTYKAPQSGPLTVKFQKPDGWEDLYLYAFTRVKVGSKYKDTPYSLDGKSPQWPGMKWTTMDGTWYTHTMKPELKEIYVIFTEGKNKPQTQDIYLTENTCYLWNPDCGKAVVDENCDGLFDEGIEEIIDNSQKNHETYKLIHEGRLVIIHNGVMYDVFGRRF